LPIGIREVEPLQLTEYARRRPAAGASAQFVGGTSRRELMAARATTVAPPTSRSPKWD
jgi:hypothetical protein